MNDEYQALIDSLRDHQNGGRRNECEEAARAIETIRAELTEARRQLNDATSYARTLVVALHRNHYAEASPNFEPFDSLVDLLSQIDNMTTGLVAAPVPPQPATIDGCMWAVTKGGRKICQPPKRDENFRAPVPHPSAVPEAVAKDAERYRWLRDRNNSLETRQYDKGVYNGPSCYHEVEGIRELKSESELDKAIDAAILSAAGDEVKNGNS